MLVYIQKKNKNVWRTVLMVQSEESAQVFDHFCKQYCKYKFRISMQKTDDMPVTLKGLSRDEALNALYDLKLADLTWNQATEVFIKIADLISQVHKRYKC